MLYNLFFKIENWKQIMNNGFDEILLLNIFKEIISINFKQQKDEIKTQYDNINKIILGHNNMKIIDMYHELDKKITSLSEIIMYLKKKKIINEHINVTSDKINDNYMLYNNYYIIDAILENIIANYAFNILLWENIDYGELYLLRIINIPYNLSFNINVTYNNSKDLLRKYIKYKTKYIKLKQIIT